MRASYASQKTIRPINCGEEASVIVLPFLFRQIFLSTLTLHAHGVSIGLSSDLTPYTLPSMPRARA